jgi:ethanolamine utilization protein EutA (predicted chaperonin)
MQAEDEIAGVGIALGAAFGGALGVTTTSGPGLALKAETIGLAMSVELPLVVIDQIGLGEGDFIDIGEPMLDGRVVPVSVKTLVFYQQPAA